MKVYSAASVARRFIAAKSINQKTGYTIKKHVNKYVSNYLRLNHEKIEVSASQSKTIVSTRMLTGSIAI